MHKPSHSPRRARVSRKPLSALILRASTAAIAGAALNTWAIANDIAWDNDSNDFLWATPSNWSTNTLPAAGDNAVFNDTPASAVGTVNLGGSTRSIDALNFANTSLTSFALGNG